MSQAHGGLNIPDITLKCDALLCHRFHHLFADDLPIWACFMTHWMSRHVYEYKPEIMKEHFICSRIKPQVMVTISDCLRKIKQLRPNITWKTASSKLIYRTLLSIKIGTYLPSVYQTYNIDNWLIAWERINENFVENKMKEISYFAAHDALFTGSFRKKRNLNIINGKRLSHTCYFCDNEETMPHLFIFCQHFDAMWRKAVDLCKERDVILDVSFPCIIYYQFPSGMNKRDIYFALIFLATAKYVIWKFRTIAERNYLSGEEEIPSSIQITRSFETMIHKRIAIDEKRGYAIW